jgi:uncharacterized protein DUF1707
MASDPRIRASDADRDRAAEALREHHALGRLSIEEFQERLDRVYEAKTLGDLDDLMSDLPAIDLYQLPIPAGHRFVPPRVPAASAHDRMSPAWRAAWASWASVTLVCVVIWLIAAVSGGAGFFWPIWVAGPFGAVLLARWIFGTGPAGSARGGPSRAYRHDLRREMRQDRHQRRDLRAGPDPGPDKPRDRRGGQGGDP